MPCSVPRRVGIVPKRSSAQASETALQVERFLRGKGVEVLLEEEAVGRDSDLVVVLGGDGTLIHAAHLLAGRPAPILGVNMGSLGFMTEVPQSEMYSALELVLAGKGTVSPRMKLRVHLHRGGRQGRPELDAEVLNDAVISKGAHSPMAELDTSYGESYLTNYKADGVFCVHGSPLDYTRGYIYGTDTRNPNKMSRIFSEIEHVCFVGHTHIPGIWTEDLTFQSPEELDYVYQLDNRKTIINVGSVGQPRDMDNRACYVLFDGSRITFRKLKYPFEKTARKIFSIPELDASLGHRLREGK